MLTLSGAADIAEFIAVARFTVIRTVTRKLTDPTNAGLACAGDAIITIRRAVRTRDTIRNLAILTGIGITSIIRTGVAVITIRRAVRTRDAIGNRGILRTSPSRDQITDMSRIVKINLFQNSVNQVSKLLRLPRTMRSKYFFVRRFISEGRGFPASILMFVNFSVYGLDL